jgi:hypothetical protein
LVLLAAGDSVALVDGFTSIEAAIRCSNTENRGEMLNVTAMTQTAVVMSKVATVRDPTLLPSTAGKRTNSCPEPSNALTAKTYGSASTDVALVSSTGSLEVVPAIETLSATNLTAVIAVPPLMSPRELAVETGKEIAAVATRALSARFLTIAKPRQIYCLARQ